MIYTRTFTAEAALTAHRLVRPGAGADTVTPATAVTDRIIGVYVGPSDAAINDQVEVCLLGECHLNVAGAIGKGMTLTTNATSQGVNAAPAAGANNRTIAWAIDAGTDVTIRVFVVPGWIQG